MKWHHFENRKRHSDDGLILLSLIKKKFSQALDVGCGDGILSYELFHRKIARHVSALDISDEAIRLSRLNLSNVPIKVEKERFQDFSSKPANENFYDLVVINPPFFRKGSGRKSLLPSDRSSRHEENLSLEEWALGSSKVLQEKGELYFVFPAARLIEASLELSKKSLIPKTIWFQKPAASHELIKRFWMRTVKGGKPGVEIKILKLE